MSDVLAGVSVSLSSNVNSSLALHVQVMLERVHVLWCQEAFVRYYASTFDVQTSLILPSGRTSLRNTS